MSPEGMDSHERDGYDAPKRRKLRQVFGAFIARHLIQGDDDVARSTWGGDLEAGARAELSDVLDTEFKSAIERAQSLLVATREARLPAYLLAGGALQGALADELQEAIQEWRVACADRLSELEKYVVTCAAHPDDISRDGKYNFCAHVAFAEGHLRRELYGRFRPDLSF